MGGSFIIKMLCPPHLCFSLGLSGAAQRHIGGSFIMKKLYPLNLFFSQGLSGLAQRQIGGSFIRKKLYPLHRFFFDCYGLARGLSGFIWGSQGSRGSPGANGGAVLSGKSYVHSIYFSLNTGGINGALDLE